MSFSLFSNNLQDHFIAEQSGDANIIKIVTDIDRADATFNWTGGSLSFGSTGQLKRAVNQTGIVLHIATFANFRIMGKQFDTITDPAVMEQVRRESTFVIEPGLIDPNQLTFRSVAFPNRVIRHKGFQLFAEDVNAPAELQSATYRRAPALMQPLATTEPRQGQYSS